MNIKISGIGFADDGSVNLSCQLQTDKIMGNFNVNVSAEEHMEAVASNSLVQLALKYINELNQEVAEFHQAQINDVLEEVKEFKATFDVDNFKNNISEMLEIEVQEFKEEQEEKLQIVKEAVRKLIRVDELTQEELQDLINIYDDYKIDKVYKIGDYLVFENNLYQAKQPHKSQLDWSPDKFPALYTKVEPEGVVPKWKQPTGAHDAYSIGNKVIYNDKIYESKINGNTIMPGTDKRYWEEV